MALVGDIDNYSEDTDMVVLMTIHSAKGLEFDNVFLVGMEEGIFPSSMSMDADDPEEEIAEECRLCYVGITRARKHLYLSAATTRMMHGNIAFNSVSRFIKEIPRHLLSMNGAVGRSNTISGNRNLTDYLGRNTMRKTSSENKNSDSNNHSRAFREKDAGRYTGNVMLNNNPYHTLPQKGISNPIQDESSLGYSVGDKVKHIKFGIGTVLEIKKGEKDFEVTVEFAAGNKKMLASFAKLKKADA